MLEINPAMLLLTMIVFLTLVVVLNKMLYKPMLSFIDARNNMVGDEAGKVNENIQSAKNLDLHAEEIIANAKSEANKIKAEATAQAKEAASEKLDTRKKELDNNYIVFLENLDNERKELQNILQSQMSSYKDGLKSKLSQI